MQEDKEPNNVRSVRFNSDNPPKFKEWQCAPEKLPHERETPAQKQHRKETANHWKKHTRRNKQIVIFLIILYTLIVLGAIYLVYRNYQR